MKLTEDELQRLLQLTHEAETTPIIAMSLKDGLEGRDWASLAWNKVRNYWAELGAKYGFIPERVRGINKETGEILLS